MVYMLELYWWLSVMFVMVIGKLFVKLVKWLIFMLLLFWVNVVFIIMLLILVGLIFVCVIVF